MKKLARSRNDVPRKLVLRSETVGILRQLSTRELRDGRIVGGTADDCKGSPPTIFSQDCEW